MQKLIVKTLTLPIDYFMAKSRFAPSGLQVQKEQASTSFFVETICRCVVNT